MTTSITPSAAAPRPRRSKTRGRELDLLARYPKTPRDPLARASARTEADRAVARRFDRAFFDGERRHGYGGYRYHPRFWKPVVEDLKRVYGLSPGQRVLDVGCAKGFLLHDLAEDIPGLEIAGVDISDYAIGHALPDVRACVQVADARALPFEDASFDLVLSLTTIHNLDRGGCVEALREVERVSRRHAFVTLDAYRNDEERRRMEAWNLTARTMMHVDDWKAFFVEVGYTGDYHWFIP
ncbi:MAG: class I SAM-dependent methyltransferase [Proteobacteria bacterium]|nr:class I SAM-dependent methyltransferase [Pseudomonadota bacterium]